MASHYRLKKFQIIPATASNMTGTAVVTSSVVEIINLDNVFVQLHFIGTPNGAFDVQVSSNHLEDPEGNVLVAGNWISLVLSPAPVAAGAPGDIGIDLNQLGASYLRVVYTNSSSTGTLSGWVSGKGLM